MRKESDEERKCDGDVFETERERERERERESNR